MLLATIGLMDEADIDVIEAGIALSLADNPRADADRLRRLMTGWAVSLQRDLAPSTAKGPIRIRRVRHG